MSDNKGLRAAAERAARRAGKLDSWSNYGVRGWPDRAPLAKPGVPAGADAGPHRHAAITRTLFSYANYKSWADKVRISWEPDKDENDR